ncbi:MAG: hypothetical protein CMN31_18875 [Sandaracinus sp.]|nr:hypothetical protein [Sandaracinus sp.]
MKHRVATKRWVALASCWVGLIGAGCSAGGGGGPSCRAGEEGCECLSGECVGGAVCVDGRCEAPSGGMDAGTPEGMDAGMVDPMGDAGPSGPADVGPNPDAFFAEDPPPMLCLEDGSMVSDPTPPGGTPECPDDKNREGCRCAPVGETAPCWPGLRVNRNRGQCMDGVTTCEPFDEFTGRWGPCEGAVLPDPEARLGPASCRCFSAGRWEIDNLSPCFVSDGTGTVTGAVSTFLSGGAPSCPSISSGPPFPPMPGTTWSTNRLTVDCEGRFELCYTLKAGDAESPSDADCVVARVCTETWYEERDATQELPELPAWNTMTAAEHACARQFSESGGYGEMSVRGLSVECDPIDDGEGGEYVFNRVNYCPSACNEPPVPPELEEECSRCMAGGSGSF